MRKRVFAWLQAITAAGLRPVVVPLRRQGDALVTDVPVSAFRR
jgi:hypothetical protein